MPSPFADWNYDTALQALNGRQKEGDESVLRYVVEHDNWQDGEGSSLPPFDGADAKTAAVLKKGTERNFTPTGTGASVVRRHRRGVVGREPGWMTTIEEGSPATEERRLLADSLILQWWNYHRGLKQFKQAVTYFKAVGRATLRIYWAPADLQTDTTGKLRMPVLPFKEALKKIYLLAPKSSEAAVILDTWSMRRAGVYSFTDRDGKSAVGLCYLDDDGRTVIKTLREGSALSERAPGMVQRVKDALTGGKPEASLPLGGNLTLFEMDGDPLITDAVLRQQKLEDKSYSMLSHSMDEAGYREEVYLNAMPPGKTVWIDDPDGSGARIEAFVKGSSGVLEKGPGTTKFIRGVAYTEKDELTGKVRTYLSTPSREVTDPVPVKSYTDTGSAARLNILRDTDQLHVEIAADATANGVSRQEARDDYKKSLDETKSEVDYVGSSAMETFLCLVAIFAGKPGYFDGVRVAFDATVDPGPVSSDDRTSNIAEVEAGLKSIEEGMRFIGIAEPEAMKKKILEEKVAAAEVAGTSLPNPPVEDKTGDGLPA